MGKIKSAYGFSYWSVMWHVKRHEKWKNKYYFYGQEAKEEYRKHQLIEELTGIE